MSKTDAAYMRAYRARRKAERESYIVYDEPAKPSGYLQAALDAANEEVRHLKEELAKRPSPNAHDIESATRTVQKRMGSAAMLREDDTLMGSFNTRPFTPVPRKKS